MQTIKAITLHSPWSEYIRDGFKSYETRHWQTNHRGLLAIHAGKTVNHEMIPFLAEEFPDQLSKYIGYDFKPGIVAICRLIHCYPTDVLAKQIPELEYELGDYTPNRFGWQLQLLETFDEPIPATGAQGIWDWSPPAGFFDNRVAVIGSRNFPEPDAIDRYIQTLPDNTIVISGGADGADSIAEYSARQRGLKVISIPVLKEEWNLYKNDKTDKSYAGMIRNQAIVDMAGTVTAFHANNSPGTTDTIKKAHAAGKTVIVNPHQSQSSTGDSTRHNRDDVLPIAQDMARALQIACEQLQIAGSLRRQKPDVKDAELVAIAKVFDGQNALHWVLDKLLEEGTIEKAKLGKTGVTRWGNTLRSWVYEGVKFDLFIVDDIKSFGIEYQIRTGSSNFNKALLSRIKVSAPFKLDGFVAYWHDTPLHIPDEKAWFKLLGLPYIAPHQRNENHLQEMFAKSWTGWGDPKEFLPKAKQLSFGGEFSMYNEAALIHHLEKQDNLKPLSSIVEKPVEWSKPWLHPDGKNVIVFNGWKDGERNYALAPIDSPVARQHARTIMGCNYMTETEALQDWIDEQAGWRPVPFEVFDAGDWSIEYAIRDETAVEETIPIADIIFTQDTYHMHHVRKYWRNPTLLDEDGDLPFGVRFAGSKSVYLLDGTHRLLGRIWRGCDALLMDVCTFPVTVEQASNRIDMNDGAAHLEFLMDVLDEAYQILEEAKEYA